MFIDLRAIALGVVVATSSIVVAVAEPSKDERASFAETFAEARPIRVILPAPWEVSGPPAAPSSTAPQKQVSAHQRCRRNEKV